MAIAENEMQNIQIMNWLSINIIDVIITTYVNSSLGVQKHLGLIASIKTLE